jgi:hypothetical protein
MTRVEVRLIDSVRWAARESWGLLELPSRVLRHNGSLAGPRGPNKVRRIQGISLISVGLLDNSDSLSS